MQTDIHLKSLMLLCAADLLPLIGSPDAQVRLIETQELPATATRLDNVLHLRSPQGQDYLHIVEWQGYYDATVLWRFAGYLAWMGQKHPGTTIVGTLIYLTPGADVGDGLRQTVDGQVRLEWAVPCVRLWEQDAVAAVASGKIGLAVLSPLMRNATPDLVEQTITTVLHQAPVRDQANLLTILGVFAEPLIDPRRFIRIVGKEKLMASDLLSYLFEDKIAEVEKAHEERLAIQEAQLRAAQEIAAVHRSQHTLTEMVSTRFPQAPITLVRTINQITDLDTLQRLMVALVAAADLPAFEQTLAQAAAEG